MSSIWLKIAHTGGATAFSVLGSVVGLAITARVLGPAGRGMYAAAIAWVALFATLGSLSLGQVVIHHISGRPEREWLDEVTGAVVAITLSAAGVGWALLWMLYTTTGGQLFGNLPPDLLALAFVALPFLMWSDAGRYLLTAIGALSVSNWSQIGGAFAAVSGVLIFVAVLDAGVSGAVVAYVSAAVLAAVISCGYLLRRTTALKVRRALIGRLLRGSAQLHLNAVGMFLFTQASVLVLNYYRSPAETGYYQLATQLFGMCLILSSSVGAVAFELVAKHGPDAAWPQQRQLLLHTSILVCVLAAIAYVLAPMAITIVAGSQFLPSAELFRILLPGLIGATFSAVMASQWVGRGLFLQAALLTLLIGVISLSCDLVLIPAYGVHGALVSTLVTYGISVLGNGGMALWVQVQFRRAGVAQPTS